MALRQAPQEPAGDALRRSDPGGTGIRRRRRGRGFSSLAADGVPVTDPRALARIKALVIPPAWQDVWICADGLASSEPAALAHYPGQSVGAWPGRWG